MWQELRTELHPKGVEFVTVCLDTAGPDAARPYIEAAKPEHPSLIDRAHLIDEHFGIVNVPQSVWIDEQGMIVRPAEPAFPVSRNRGSTFGSGLPDRMAEIMQEASKIPVDADRYLAGLRDWAERGAESPVALSPDEVVARSRPRGREAAEAAAHFELGQHLWREGHEDDAVPHFREAHRLQPENWTYKRQAWSLASRVGGAFDRFWQGPVEGQEADWPYDSDWLSDVRAVGAENYHQPLDMPAVPVTAAPVAAPAPAPAAAATAAPPDDM